MSFDPTKYLQHLDGCDAKPVNRGTHMYQKSIKCTCGMEAFLEAFIPKFGNSAKYRVEINQYFKSGSMLGSHLEAQSAEDLQNKIDDYTQKAEKEDRTEFISFYSFRFIPAGIKIPGRDSKKYFVEETTNPYLFSQAKKKS